MIGYLLLVAAGVVAYWPTLNAGFVWNDDTFLTENPLIHAPDGLFRFWATKQAEDFWPVTSTTLWLEWRLWGPNAAGYHATHVLLHTASTVLLWRVLSRLRIRGALLGALLFAVHPVNVESVAWITQRKNLMAILFFLASIRFFIEAEFRRHPIGGPSAAVAPPGFQGTYYGLSLLTFALAMLSKGSVAPLPLVLAGIILWRRKFSLSDAVRLSPFVLIAVGLSAVNIWFQRHGTGSVIRDASPAERLVGAGAAVGFYLWKALVPVRLSFIYPQWSIKAGDPLWWIPLLAAVGITLLLRRYSRKGFFGWAYFCVMLVPVLGFTDIYFMSYSLVADHYQHLALIGVTTLAGFALQRVAGNRAPRAIPAIVVCVLCCLTYRQCQAYTDSESLYRATLTQNPDCWLAHNNLGNLLFGSGRAEEAIEHYERAVQLKPGDAKVRSNLGVALNLQGLSFFEAGKIPTAVACYERALRLDPDDVDALNNLGGAQLTLGRTSEAIGLFQRALLVKPNAPEMWYNLGNALAASGRLVEAVADYKRALRLRPDYPNALRNLAQASEQAARQGDTP